MKLYDFILHIQAEQGLGVLDFMNEANISNGMYYNIRNLEKNNLSPLQLNNLKKVFPNINYELLDQSFSEKKAIKKNVETPLKYTLENLPDLSLDMIEIMYLKNWTKMKDRPMTNTVIISEVELSVAKRLLKLKEEGELKKYLNLQP